MKHISEVIYDVEVTPQQRVDPFVRAVFRNVPEPLRRMMLAKHSDSEQHVLECWECWLVAKHIWEQRLALAER